MERTRAASKQPAWNGWLIGAAIALLPWHVAAQEAPEAIIQRLSQEVLGRAKADLAGPDADLRRAMALVDSAIMPHVNMQRLTAAAVGPAWRQATPQQRVRFQQEIQVSAGAHLCRCVVASDPRDDKIAAATHRARRERRGRTHGGAGPRRTNRTGVPDGKDVRPRWTVAHLQPECAGHLAR